MANMNDAYDSTNGEGMRDVAPLKGWHKCTIVETERRAPNEKGNSQLKIKFQVMDGECEGRHSQAFLSLWNNSAQAKEIADRAMNSICEACGKLRSQVIDSDMLIGIPMMVLFGPQKDAPQYAEPKAYKSLNAAPGGQQQQTGQSSGGNAPWKKSA